MALREAVVGLGDIGGIGNPAQIRVALGEDVGARIVFKMDAARAIHHIGKAHIENGIEMGRCHVRMVLLQQREHFVKADSVILCQSGGDELFELQPFSHDGIGDTRQEFVDPAYLSGEIRVFTQCGDFGGQRYGQIL